MKYVIYKIINIVNNKIYVGIHKTLNPNDNYFGSGKLIIAAIKKYGLQNFRKEILFEFYSLEEAASKEKEIVNEAFVARDDTYNLSIGGGLGGKDINGLTFYGRKHTRETKEKLRISSTGRKLPPEAIAKIIIHNKTHQKRKENISKTLTGRKFTEEHRKNVSKGLNNYSKLTGKTPGKQKGFKRQYKHVWINNGEIQTRIKEYEIIPEGWFRGRLAK